MAGPAFSVAVAKNSLALLPLAIVIALWSERYNNQLRVQGTRQRLYKRTPHH